MKSFTPTKKIVEVCDIVNGGTPDTKVKGYWGGEYLWITPKDMGRMDGKYVDNTERKITLAGLNNSSAKLLPKNSVILSSRAPIGHLAINIKEIATNQGCKGLIPKKELDTHYLYYFLENSVDLLNELGSGTTFKELSGSKLAEINISLPSLSEQQRIVSILDKAFAAIDKIKKNIELNLRNTSELFDSHLNQLFFNDEYKWKKSTIESLVEDDILCKPLDGNHGEIHPKSSDYVEKGVPFIMASDIKNDAIDLIDCKFIKKSQAERLRKGFAKDGDVLLSHKATIGQCAVLNTEYEYVMLTPQVTYYRIKNKDVLFNRYIYYYFKSRKFQDEIKEYASVGTTRAYIGITKQLKLSFIYPSINEQQLIVNKLDKLLPKIKNLVDMYKQKIVYFDELKKSLLHKAFTGELTRTEAAIS